MRKYNLTLQVNKWIVKKDHLRRIFDLFSKRFPGQSDLKINISFDEEEIPFNSFDKFDRCVMDEVIALSKRVKIIRISASKGQRNSLKYAILNIYFEFDGFDFNVMGQGAVAIKDWVHGFKNDLESLLRSFEPDDELINLIKSKDVERYKFRSSVVFFDYEGQLEKIPKMEAQNPTVVIKDSLIHLGQGDNVAGSKNINNKESLGVKLFWGIFVTIVVGVIITAISKWLGFN
jgi:hypothetical protein